MIQSVDDKNISVAGETNNSNNGDEVKEDEYKDYKLKWCCFEVKKWIVDWKLTFTFLCICCFFENFIISGTATVILSTLEKEFYLSSGQSGLFLSIYEFSAFIASPIVGFVGNRFNKMKIIAVSLFLISLGIFPNKNRYFFGQK